ncbi:MAG: hypothetical protein GX079_06705, partial [Tissierellia bacterium]|nr:hypothetical protein [Tissierellia bacterium]
MKRKTYVSLLLVLLLLLVSCGSKNEGKEEVIEEGRVLRIAKSVDPDGLDPQRSVAESTFEITSIIYDTLMEVEEDGSLIPGIADSYEISEDGLIVSFKI